jgi:hypothetical protein
MTRLPVRAIEVLLRRPDGADDVALIEGDQATLPTALRLLGRLVARSDCAVADWSLLPVTDFELLLLHLRQFLIGPVVASHVDCPSCDERVEVSFQVADFVAAVRPSEPSGVALGPDDGSLTLAGATFRLPILADVLAVWQTARPGAALRARCISHGTAAKLHRRIERASARLAPPVTGAVGGACPGCGRALQALFDVPSYVVAEMRSLAAGVYAEVHLLATAYGWSEAAILALPSERRRHYAELVRSDVRGRALVA